MNRPLAILVVLGFSASLLTAQQASSSKVNVVAEVFPARLLPGSAGSLVLTLSIAPGWHISAHGTTGEYVLPTGFGWTPPAGFTVTKMQYPAGEPVKVAFQEEPLVAYQDEIQIVLDFRVGDSTRPGTIPLVGEVSVQACSDEVCLLPSDLEVSVPVEILRPIRLKKKIPR